LIENDFKRGQVDTTLFGKTLEKDILVVQIYVDDIIFGSTNASLCKEFSKLMQNEFEMSMMVFACVFAKLRGSSDYYKQDQTRDLRSMLCKGFERKKGFEKEPQDALRLLRE
jgi:hypothetical protein